MPARTPDEALTAAARIDAPKVLSILAARFGDLDLADDAVQDALVDAARAWPRDGVPDNVGGWLMTVARRRAIDRLRVAKREAKQALGAGPDLIERDVAADSGPADLIDDRGGISSDGLSSRGEAGHGQSVERQSSERQSGERQCGTEQKGEDMEPDERLRLLLLCCHPALDRDAQVALTLRLVGGLTTPEISAAFVVPEATLAQRIVRAKRKIRDAKIPLSLPTELNDRLDVVLAVLYLVFNEGYLSRGVGESAIRVDMVDEAVRLTELLVALVPESAEAAGLLSLELFHRARSSSRVDATGGLILLDEQDRTSWDLPEIERANRFLHQAMERMEPGPFQMQAVIAAHHANARTPEETDWSMIVALYDQLESMTSSPIVALNGAVATAMADGPLAGLARLDEIVGLDAYHLFWSTRGELARRAGRDGEAVADLRRALDLVTNEAERRLIEHRIARVEASP